MEVLAMAAVQEEICGVESGLACDAPMTAQKRKPLNSEVKLAKDRLLFHL